MQSAAIQRYGVNQCPHNPAQIVQECGDSVPCLYDYSMLDSRILGMEASNSWNAFTLDRSQASRHCTFISFKTTNKLQIMRNVGRYVRIF